MGFYEESKKAFKEIRESLDKIETILKTQRTIIQNGRYALIDRGYEYVVACGYEGEGKSWQQGYYYSHWDDLEKKGICLTNALDHYMLLTNENYISKGRLEELATHFKDGLLCDDEEAAMEYFERICDMDEKEMQFFGIERRKSNG